MVLHHIELMTISDVGNANICYTPPLGKNEARHFTKTKGMCEIV